MQHRALCLLLLLLLVLLASRTTAAASTPNISAAELPRRPESSCNSAPAVRAVMRCSQQPTRGCCEALDSVWGTRASQSYG
jgi:hypothetical protein